MSSITHETSMLEIATLVSEALEAAGVSAVLGGDGAVSQYSDNEYMTTDLDFITVERNRVIAPIVAELGFALEGKDFHHPKSKYFLEFPPGPISFGDRYVDSSETTSIDTPFGKLRIITPTQCVLDRLAWFIHRRDRQARDQAIMVARRQEIDWDDVYAWARNEGVDAAVIAELREEIEAE
ncbi:MAG: hypothetical protein GY949_06485 [Gammaproteobacteria bacterium]|nr:hypothetical protein [Gammaproteobacteria bacterium]